MRKWGTQKGFCAQEGPIGFCSVSILYIYIKYIYICTHIYIHICVCNTNVFVINKIYMNIHMEIYRITFISRYRYLDIWASFWVLRWRHLVVIRGFSCIMVKYSGWFWNRREGGKAQPLKEWHSHWGYNINWLEPIRSKMAEDSTSSRPWASLYTHCNTLAYAK